MAIESRFISVSAVSMRSHSECTNKKSIPSLDMFITLACDLGHSVTSFFRPAPTDFSFYSSQIVGACVHALFLRSFPRTLTVFSCKICALPLNLR